MIFSLSLLTNLLDTDVTKIRLWKIYIFRSNYPQFGSLQFKCGKKVTIGAERFTALDKLNLVKLSYSGLSSIFAIALAQGCTTQFLGGPKKCCRDIRRPDCLSIFSNFYSVSIKNQSKNT